VPGSNFSDMDLCSVSEVEKENSFTFYKTTPHESVRAYPPPEIKAVFLPHHLTHRYVCLNL
jgi:hypothetical protein